MMKQLALKKLDHFLGPLLLKLLPAARQKQMPRSIVRVLVIRPGGIGDAVLLAPSLNRIRESFPVAQIDVLAETRNAAAFRLVPSVDNVFRYDKISEFWACLTKRYSVVVDSEQWYRLSSIIARFIRTDVRIGFSTNERRKIFHYKIPYSLSRYEIDSFEALLRPLVGTGGAVVPFLTVPEAELSRACTLTSPFAKGRYVVLFPGASIPEKKWATSKYIELARLLERDGLSVVVVGGKQDQKTGDEIVGKLKSGLNLAGKCSLTESAGVLKNCGLLISGDSGLLHIGVGLDKPTVSLFGPSSVSKWGPKGEKHRVVHCGLACSPCSEFGMTPQCSEMVKCLSQISVAQIYSESLTLLTLRGDG